jgi:hypothetical protein
VTTHALLRASLALASVAIGATSVLVPVGQPEVALAGPTTTSTASAAATTATKSVGPQRTVLRATFDRPRRGPVDPASFNAQVGRTNTDQAAYAGMIYRKDYRGSGRGNVVRTTLSGGKTIHSKGPGRGNVLMIKLPGAYDSACMSYDVRFAGPTIAHGSTVRSGPVDFAAGGKLPGFVGVAPGTSPSAPEGGRRSDHGWSGRLMWLGARTWKPVREAKAPNLAVTYLYHPGQRKNYGDNVYWKTSSFRANVWHTIRQCHVMNTVGRADGVLQTWFDGRLVLDQRDVVYRTDPKVHITHFDWSIFRGGDGSAQWAGSHTSYVDMDNLTITAG